jgi:peptidoglycan-associated lipoprotein
MKDVFFDYDKFDIRADAASQIAANARFLAQHPNIRFLIEGHCDERGSTEYNLGLGDNRASSTKEALVRAGVSADRIRTMSFGKEKPFCTESNETCWQQNRRGHFVYQK